MQRHVDLKWSSVEDAWRTSSYVDAGAYEFECDNGRARMYFHAPVSECVSFFIAAQAWLRETSFEGARVEMLTDTAGSQVEVHTEDTPNSRSSLGQLYMWTQQ
jgi:hypothetical protein